MLKLGFHCLGLLKQRWTPSQFYTKHCLLSPQRSLSQETYFPHKASGRLGKALSGLITCKAFGRPGLWLGSSSFRSGLPYLPYLGTLSGNIFSSVGANESLSFALGGCVVQ